MKVERNNPNFVKDIIDKCFMDANSRKSEYARLRFYALYGSDDPKSPSAYNAIGKSMSELNAFLFSGDTTLYSVTYPDGSEVSYDLKQIEMAHIASQQLQNRWHVSNIDSLVAQAIYWAGVYNSMIVKLKWKNKEPHGFLIEPSDFGVLNDGILELDKQEAFCHRIIQPYDTFKRDMDNYVEMEKLSRDDADAICELAKERSVAASDDLGSELENLIVTSVNNPVTGAGTYQGSMSSGAVSGSPYEKVRKVPTVERYEVWIYNDLTQDYDIVDYIEPRLILSWGGNYFLEGEHPFIKITPEPLYNYFWGDSTVRGLTALQDWHTQRLQDIRWLLDRQIDPNFGLSGFVGAAGEKIDAIQFSFGSGIPLPDGSKVEPFKIDVPEDVFKEIAYIIEMMRDRLGITEVMQGKGASGIRSREHAALSSSLGSSRIRGKSLIIEDSLEKLGYILFQLMRKHDDTEYVLELDGKKTPFTLGMLQEGFYVQIDAHSSSPVFMEDLKGDTYALFKAKIIDANLALDMIKFPNRQLAKLLLKKSQMEEAQKLARMSPQERILTLKAEAGGKK